MWLDKLSRFGSFISPRLIRHFHDFRLALFSVYLFIYGRNRANQREVSDEIIRIVLSNSSVAFVYDNFQWHLNQCFQQIRTYFRQSHDSSARCVTKNSNVRTINFLETHSKNQFVCLFSNKTCHAQLVPISLKSVSFFLMFHNQIVSHVFAHCLWNFEISKYWKNLRPFYDKRQVRDTNK